MTHRKKKRHHGLVVLLVILMIAAGFLYVQKDTLRQTAAQHAAETILRQQLVQNGLSSQQADQILSSVDEQDKKQIAQIIVKNVDADTLSEAVQDVKNGDVQHLENLAHEKLSDTDLKTLEDIAEKYIPQGYN